MKEGVFSAWNGQTALYSRPAFVRDKENENWHWFGIVQGNINADSKSGRITYVVYQPLYRAKLTEAIRKYP